MHVGDRQTDKQTDSPNALSHLRYSERRLNKMLLNLEVLNVKERPALAQFYPTSLHGVQFMNMTNFHNLHSY